MANNKKYSKLIEGCQTPQDVNLKHRYKRLAEMFAPVLCFDPAERFFPVDLPSAVKASALHQVKGKKYQETAPQVKNYGNIGATDLDNVERNSFTTVVGWNTEIKKLEDGTSISMPIPKLDEIFQKYSTGNFLPNTPSPKLTVYATVCLPKKTPNYHFLEQIPPTKEVANALAEGLLLNYYFYFPAMESTQLKREGDWSGISILFPNMPVPEQLDKSMLPVLTCYFRKIGDFFVAGDDGFRRWDSKDLKKVKHQGVPLATHPKVYITRRHNCYYDLVNRTIPMEPPWNPGPDPHKIEAGDYSPSITNTLSGGAGSVAEPDPVGLPMDIALFGGLVHFFYLCGTVCGGDLFPDHLLQGTEDGNDNIQPGGYSCDPETTPSGAPPGSSDSYPSGPPPTGSPAPHLKLNVVYVDLHDKATRSHWGYKGSWGAAEVSDYVKFDVKKTSKEHWGVYGGFERPNLAPWFLWNLYWDPTFGSGGGDGYQTSSP